MLPVTDAGGAVLTESSKIHDRGREMDNENRCHFSVCTCNIQAGTSYCSDDCLQAASQGMEREFCQCSHTDCQRSDTGQARDNFVSGSITTTTGRVTIEYSSMYDLVDQLIVIATALDEENYNLLRARITATDRRPPSSEARTWLSRSKSA